MPTRTLALMAALVAPGVALTRSSRARGSMLGALVGDALSLGGHYEYDAHVIADRIGSYKDFSA